MEKKNKVTRVQELRRSNAATPIPSKKKYKRKSKNQKEKYLKTYCELIAPFFRQLKFQQARTKEWGPKARYGQVTTHPRFCEIYHKINLRHADTQMVNVGGFGYNCAINKRKEKMIDKSNWKSYPFTVDGVEFLSLIDPNGSMYSQIQRVPAQVFSLMNEQAIREIIGSVSNLTKSEIQAELDKVNLGYSQAYLALA